MCMLLACCSIPVLHIVLIHVTKKYGESGLPLLTSCVACLLTWCAAFIYAISSNHLYLDITLIPPALTSLCIYFGFVLGYLEFFSLINRGYSLSIMMDISRREAPPNVIELEREYADGTGLGWMLTKRLNGLKALRLVKEEDGHLILKSGWPERFACFFIWAKIVFSIRRSG